MSLIRFQQIKNRFWWFHLWFWLVAFVLLALSGLSQGMTLEMALSRNLIYSLLGIASGLAFLALWEIIARYSHKVIVLSLLGFAYGVGSLSSVLVNQAMIWLFDLELNINLATFLFGGTLNFSLVILVWCGFYLYLKQGLSFEAGEEEQKTAKAIASISNMSRHPDFIALERLNKISLLPVSKISLIKAAGDYVEFICEGETYLKRDTISNIEMLLDPKIFQRVHRSAIVNLRDIQEMVPRGRGDFTITLRGGEAVSCSRTYMDKLKNRVDIAL